MSHVRKEIGEQPLDLMNLKLLYISTSKYEGDWHSTFHAHQCTELFYVVSGEGEFRVEELTFPVVPNDMVIINPNVEHTETALHRSPMEYIVLGVEGGDFLVRDGSDPRYTAFNCGGGGRELHFYMKEMLGELEERAPHFTRAAHNLLEIFSIKLMRHKAVSVELQPTQKSSRKCSHVKRYIDNHYTENLTLDALAEIAHLNRYYLVHAFTKEIGVSPINYLIQRRIEESRYFLANTNYSISQIAQILGFSSSSYFSQSFSRLEKLSPREYRRKALLEKEAAEGEARPQEKRVPTTVMV